MFKLQFSLSMSLGADPEEYLSFYDGMFGESKNNGSSLRVLHYPAVLDQNGREKSVTRVGEHTDYGGLTLLYQVRSGCN